MSAPVHVVENSSRAVSPVLLVAAALCFLLPFGGVSCNTSAAKTLVNSFGSTATASQLQQSNACLDALNGYTLATYSGLNLAFGTAPSTNASPPSACATGSSTPSSTVSADQAKTDAQPLVLAGGIVVVIAFLLSLGLIGMRRLRAAAVSVAAVVALGLVLVGQVQVQSRITDRIAKSFASGEPAQSLPSGLSLNIGDYFNVNWMIGIFLVIAALAVLIVINLAALITNAATPAAAQLSPLSPPWHPPPGGPAPPGAESG